MSTQINDEQIQVVLEYTKKLVDEIVQQATGRKFSGKEMAAQNNCWFLFDGSTDLVYIYGSKWADGKPIIQFLELGADNTPHLIRKHGRVSNSELIGILDRAEFEPLMVTNSMGYYMFRHTNKQIIQKLVDDKDTDAVLSIF